MDTKKLTDDEIYTIARDGMLNAAGGIYSTRVVEFARSVEEAVLAASQSELASMTRMFHAAAADLGAINEALGLDPEDGGAEPIIGAIDELKAKIAALAPSDAGAPLTDDALMTAIKSVCDFGAERAEKWRPEALAIGRAVERAVLNAQSSDSASVPVAWRYLTPTGWHTTTDEGKVLRVSDHHEVQPLYAAPVAPKES